MGYVMFLGLTHMHIFASKLSICSRRQLGCAVVRDAVGHLGLVAVGGTGDTEQVSHSDNDSDNDDDDDDDYRTMWTPVWSGWT